jgi:DNA-binding transcriptional ArsR family regulator
MANDLRQLIKEDPDQAKAKILKWLAEGKTLKALAEELEEPYPTLHRICRDLGLKGLGASFLNAITDEDWSTLSKGGVAKKYGLSYSHVYNFYVYHKEDIEQRIRNFRASQKGGD